jgi:arylsulfatase A-like enzyme
LNGEDWELYDLKNDPTEINNLAIDNLEKLNELVRNYEVKKLELEEATR